MSTRLQAQGVTTQPERLLFEIQRVALQLRTYDIWRYREPLELEDLETGDRIIRSDLAVAYTGELTAELIAEAQEQQECLAFFHEQLQHALAAAIQSKICDRLAHLRKSKRYAAFADQYLIGLQLYYQKGRSLREISTVLGMSSWAQARRILNPGELISVVRSQTIRQVLAQMLKKAEEKGLTQLPADPDYLKNLAEQIEALADAEIFQQALEEIRSGKNRLMKSVYAQQLCLYLKASTKTVTANALTAN